MARIRKFEDGETFLQVGDERTPVDQIISQALLGATPAQQRMWDSGLLRDDMGLPQLEDSWVGSVYNVEGLGGLPFEALRTGDRVPLGDLQKMFQEQMHAYYGDPSIRWRDSTLPDRNMTFEQYLASPFSGFDTTGTFQQGKRTQVPYGLSGDPNFTRDALMKAAAAFAGGAALGGLAGGLGAGGTAAGAGGAMDMGVGLEGLFNYTSPAGVAGGASNFLSGSPYLVEGADFLGGEFATDLASDYALDSLGSNWMDDLTLNLADTGTQGGEGIFGGEYLGNADTWVEPESWWPEDWSDALDHPVPGETFPNPTGNPTRMPIPTMPPSPGQSSEPTISTGVPEWVQQVATTLGTSPAVLGRILGGAAGAVSGTISGNQTANVGKEQVALGAPGRARFEQMSAAPGEWAKANTRGLVDAAADRRARQWSQKVGNPAESPTATIATDLDLAQLMWEMEQGEKELQLRAGQLGLAGYDDIIAGRDARGRAISGGVGSVFDSIFNPRKEQTTADVIAQLMLQYPQLFGRTL